MSSLYTNHKNAKFEGNWKIGTTVYPVSEVKRIIETRGFSPYIRIVRPVCKEYDLCPVIEISQSANFSSTSQLTGVTNTNLFKVFNGTTWVDFPSGGFLGNTYESKPVIVNIGDFLKTNFPNSDPPYYIRYRWINEGEDEEYGLNSTVFPVEALSEAGYDEEMLDGMSSDISNLQTEVSGKAPANHTHDFGAYAEKTQFEVYATNAVISAGTVDSDTGLAYAENVPASMSHYFKLRTDTLQADQDVSVDWGDGSTSVLKNGDFDAVDTSEWESAGECVYSLHHTYSTPGKYIVTVNGKNYWSLQTGPFTNGGTSILSRMFTSDLPLASWVMNLANCCASSPKLQSIRIPTGMDLFTNIHNASGVFSNCVNLLSATNFATKFQYTRYVSSMFKGCSNLVTCDFRIPQNSIKTTAYKSVYEGCAALTANIANLLPERGFDGVNVDISRCFYGCSSLTGVVPDSILWNDMRVVWTHANVFTGCPAAILAQVPVSWGGTASEVEDPHPITRSQVTAVIGSKVDEAIQNISFPSTVGGGTGNILGGYAVKATAYNASTFTLTVDPGEENNETDMSKFAPGTVAYVSELSEDIDPGSGSGSGSGSEDEEVWGTYKSAEIASVDSVNHTITFTEDIGLSSSSDFDKVVVRVADTSRKDAAFSSGDRNFVTGLSASADGLINTVTGIGSKAQGSMNLVSGNFSEASGVGNTVIGDRSIVSGGNNKVEADLAFVTGNGNEISKTGQGAVVLGGGNNDVTGVDPKILGDGNKVSGNRVNVIGFHNTVSGDESSVLGNSLTVAAKKAVLIGQRGSLPNTFENLGAIGFAGGDSEEGDQIVSFIHRTHKTDPLDSEKSEQAFNTEYRGRLIPKTLQIADIGTIELDHDQYARWELTGTGAVTLTLANWQDGDRGEVVIDTTKQTFSIPAAWVVPDEVWDEWTETPGKYCMEIRKEGGAVFAHAAVPFNAGGGGSSSGEWTIGANGNWYCDGIDTGNPSRGPQGPTGATGAKGAKGAKGDTGDTFNVVVSSTQPANPTNGTIWIQS